MKKNVIISIITLICFTSSIYGQITVISNGNVGIGGNITNPDAKLVVEGSFKLQSWTNMIIDMTGANSIPVIYPTSNGALQFGKSNFKIGDIYGGHLMVDMIDCGSFHAPSDSSIKMNIKAIESPLEKIRQLNGVKYDYKPSIYTSASKDIKNKLLKSGKNRYGFLAQDVQKIMPEIVDSMQNNKLLGVNYIDLIPVLVEAVKELSIQIDSLNKLLIDNNVFPDDLFLKSATQNNLPSPASVDKSSDKAVLYQNTPNPFSKNTSISYNIPFNVQRAMINIYDMNGMQIKSNPIDSRGDGVLSIQGNELRPGMYLYTLIVDGQEVATKRMILTQ